MIYNILMIKQLLQGTSHTLTLPLHKQHGRTQKNFSHVAYFVAVLHYSTFFLIACTWSAIITSSFTAGFFMWLLNHQGVTPETPHIFFFWRGWHQNLTSATSDFFFSYQTQLWHHWYKFSVMPLLNNSLKIYTIPIRSFTHFLISVKVRTFEWYYI